MQSPLSRQKTNNAIVYTFPVFALETALLDYGQLTAVSFFILNTVSLGDAKLSVPSDAFSDGLSSIMFKAVPQVLLDVGGIVRQLGVGITSLGAIPGIAGRGIFIDGALTNYTLVGESGVLQLPDKPSIVDLSNMYGVLNMPASFNNASWPITAGIVHKWKVWVEIKIVVTDRGSN